MKDRMNTKLTGKIKYRTQAITGKLVLQVEESCMYNRGTAVHIDFVAGTSYRDAIMTDLAELYPYGKKVTL